MNANEEISIYYVLGTISLIATATLFYNGESYFWPTLSWFIVALAFFSWATLKFLSRNKKIVDWIARLIFSMLPGDKYISEWFTQHPVRFYFVGLAIAFLVVGFLDTYKFSDKWGNILVEAHGLIFDLLVFGIVLALYETIRNKQENIKRWEEELNDYKGWTEPEAAYRVAGLIERIRKAKGGLENMDVSKLENLHLGKSKADVIEKIIQNTIQIASLEGAQLDRANLKGADLGGVNLSGAKLRHTTLEGADLGLANLEGANLLGATLEGANLWDATLEGANLWYANLKGAKLWYANLKGANLIKANLKGANLWYANLEGANLIEANLEGAQLQNANLEDVIIDEEKYLMRIKG